MRCLFRHVWAVREKSFIRSVVLYRTCERCGALEHASHQSLSGEITWQKMSTETAHGFQQINDIRRSISWLDRLFYSLGADRSGMNDKYKYQNISRRWPDACWRKHHHLSHS